MAPANVPQGKGRGADREDEDAGAPGQGVPAWRAAPPPPPESLSAPGAPRGSTSGVEDEAGLSPTRPPRRRGLSPSSVLLVPGPHGGPGSLWVPLLFCYTDTPPLRHWRPKLKHSTWPLSSLLGLVVQLSLKPQPSPAPHMSKGRLGFLWDGLRGPGTSLSPAISGEGSFLFSPAFLSPLLFPFVDFPGGCPLSKSSRTGSSLPDARGPQRLLRRRREGQRGPRPCTAQPLPSTLQGGLSPQVEGSPRSRRGRTCSPPPSRGSAGRPLTLWASAAAEHAQGPSQAGGKRLPREPGPAGVSPGSLRDGVGRVVNDAASLIPGAEE